ncbi:DUF2786 domain-containing protein [Blastococcus sp. SYSU D00820]
MTATSAVDRRLLDAVASVWERGWRPADLVHVLAGTAPELVALAAEAAVASVEALGETVDLPGSWVAQLDTVRQRARGSRATAGDVALLLAHLRALPRLPHLGEVPSRWPRRRRAAEAAGQGAAGDAGDAGRDADRALRRIRSLLAKAESTEFPDEAEALSAKAQELMAAHAIDATLLAAAPGRAAPPPGAAERRLHLEAPYLDAKMHLVSAVAQANGVRAAWFSRYGIAVLVGMPADLDATELLATSLLVQAARAMLAAGRQGGGHARSRAFRRAFLLAYAVRVGERLTAARDAATERMAAERGTDLAPVLRNRDATVTRAFEELFPRLRTRRSTTVDPSGWLSGRAAADSADLAGTRRLAP